METINGTKNPIIKTLKEGDIVLVEVPSAERAAFKQICKLHNLKYYPADEQFDFDWLDFDAEILYTNYRMHKSMIKCIGNCLAIEEILDPSYVEIYVRQNDMWKPEMYQLSDVELETRQTRLLSSLGLSSL